MSKPFRRWWTAILPVLLALPAAAAPPVRVLVVPFTVTANSPWADLGAASAEVIGSAIAQVSAFEVVDWHDLRDHARAPLDQGDLPAILQRSAGSGIQLVMIGDWQVQGDSLTMSGRFVKPDGSVIGQARVSGKVRELFALQTRLTEDLLRQGGITVPTAEATRLHQHLAPTQDVAVLRLLSEGHALRRRGTSAAYQQAIRHYEMALASDPDCVPALAAKAETLARLAFLRSHGGDDWAVQAQEARRLASEAVARAPNLSEAHRALAFSLVVLGEPAAASVEQALSLSPHDPETLTLQWMASQGKAQEALVRALKIHPQLAIAMDGIGLSHLRQGRIGEALDALGKAARANPGDPLAHLHLGLALKQNWRLAEALNELRTAIRLDPDLALAHYHSGRVLQAQGHLEEAAEAYRMALQVSPRLEEARQAIAVVRRLIASEAPAGRRNREPR